MAKTAKRSSPARAVADIRKLRDRLAREIPAFADAVQLEREIDEFCRAVRKDLRDQRKQRGIDQTELGDRMDLSQSAVSKIETAEGDLGLKTVFRYANAVGLRPVIVFIPSTDSILAAEQAPADAPETDWNKALALQDAQVSFLQQVSSDASALLSNLIKEK